MLLLHGGIVKAGLTMAHVLFWLVVAAYSVAAVLIVFNLLRGIMRPSVLSWWLVLAGWLGQMFPLAQRLVAAKGQLAVNLAASLELSALVMGLLYLIGWRIHRQAARPVGGILLPLMVITLLGSRLLPTAEPKLRAMSDPLLTSHLLLSLLAYGLLSIAVVLALMDAFQERALKTKHLGRLFTMLPPLGALEETLFLMVRMGFLLLTLSILSGGFYSHYQHGVVFHFSHKVVFSWATWLVFGTLLIGRYFQGWRGRRAARFTLWGYLLLVLAFLGVKFVYEIVL